MEAHTLNNPTSLHFTPEKCEPQSSSSSSSGKQPMSTTLRERLKKARRSFNSAFTVAKHFKISEENDAATSDEDMTVSKKGQCSTSQYKDKTLEKVSDKTMFIQSDLQDRALCEFEYNGCSKTEQNSLQVTLLETNCSQLDLLKEKKKFVKQIQEKEEILRRLKLVKMYRAKNNLIELQSLIAKWRSSSQRMLYVLHSTLSTDGKKLSIMELIDNFGLDDQLLHYSRKEEDFTDV